jgi:hypothetical protein
MRGDDLQLTIGDRSIPIADVDIEAITTGKVDSENSIGFGSGDLTYSGSMEFDVEFFEEDDTLDLMDEIFDAYFRRREKELYAAWRSDYDYLFILSDNSLEGPKYSFIPSNVENIVAGQGVTVERYDVADRHLSALAREKLREWEP